MPAPANDLVANATPISGTSGSVGPVTIDDATETDTQDSTNFMHQTIWYKWVAPSSGRLTLSTLGGIAGDIGSGDGNPDVGAFGSLDTKMNLWHGTSPGSLAFVAFNDDTNIDPSGYGGYWSRIAVGVTAGETYYIQVGTYGTGFTGTVVLGWSLLNTAVANDNIANAIVIGGTVRTGSSGPLPIDAATLEAGETTNGQFGANQMHQTLWWKWTVDTYLPPSFTATSNDFTPRLIVYWSPDGSTNFAQFESVWYASSGVTPSLAFVEPGWVLYISVGTFANGQSGDIDLSWDLGFPFVDVIPECPVDVIYQDVSAPNERFQPHAGDAGQFNDMTIDWYEPPHVAGDLLVFVGISTKLGLSVPPGYAEVFNDVWDDAPITPPIHGTNSTTIGPAWNRQCQQFIGYRIATGSGGSDSVAAGSYGGFSYNDNGGAYYSNAMASNVYRFSLETMFQNFDPPSPIVWPANPVKVGPLNWESYKLELGPDCDGNGDGSFDGRGACGDFYPNVDTPGPNIVPVTDVVADHPGNHIWMTIVERHGPILADFAVSYPSTKQGSSMQLNPGQKRTTGRPGIDTFGGMDAGVGPGGTTEPNDHDAVAFLSSTSYFNPFRPYGSPDEPTVGQFGENGFVDTTFCPNFEVTGHVGTDWADGFIGIAGTNTGDFYTWDLLGGVATQQIVIQGPETQRPTNDNRADAYDITTCPVTVVECVYGQSSEPGEPFPNGVGDGTDNSVWFRFIPTVSQLGLVMKTYTNGEFFTTYDTILSVFDSNMNLIVSNDDFSAPGSFRTSQVTLDVTAGSLYYIQVVGRGGDEGDLYLSIDCTGELLAYWGIDVSLVT
jgi:hypothetical protein